METTENQKDNTKVINKIKKLLRLSKSDNIGEANNALRLAQKLMAENGIFIKETEELDKEQSAMSKIIEEKTRGLSAHRRRLATALAKEFKVRILLAGGLSGRLEVVGLEEDIDIFIEVFEWTYLVFKKLCKQYLENRKKELGRLWNRSISLRMQNDYFEGFVNGVILSLKQNCKEHGLMVITPKAVESLADEMTTGTCKSQGPIKLGDMDAMMNGVRDGREAKDMKKRIS